MADLENIPTSHLFLHGTNLELFHWSQSFVRGPCLDAIVGLIWDGTLCKVEMVEGYNNMIILVMTIWWLEIRFYSPPPLQTTKPIYLIRTP